MKKIAIDITALSDQYKSRGIGTYTENILIELIKSKKYEWHLLGFSNIEKRFSKMGNVKFHSLANVKNSSPFNIIYFRLKYLPLIKKIKPDLYFAPHFERGLPIGVCTIVVSVHDIFPYISNKFSNKGKVFNYLKGTFYKYNLNNAKKADVVITDSNFSREELEKVGFEKEKIKVTYLGLSKKFDTKVLKSVVDRDAVLRRYSITKPYIFYYGGFEPNKNIDKLLKSFAKVKREEDIRLVILDKNLYRKDGKIIAGNEIALKVKKEIKKLGVGGSIILPSFIDWRDLPIVHAEAIAFVHLSKYEGFGLAVLEAMSTGCPVIAANKSCYPEVLGDGAVLVNPTNTDLVAYHILKVMRDKKLRENLRKKGIRQSRKYSWEKCGKETLRAFENVLSNKS